MTTYLTVDEVIKVHDSLIEQHGGLQGIRDLGLLTSAMEMPKSAYGGHELHPTLFDKASAYLYHIARNHPFCDGNKRSAAFIAILFLRMNDVPIKVDVKQYEVLVIGTAEGLISKAQIALFFERSRRSALRQAKKKTRHTKRRGLPS